MTGARYTYSILISAEISAASVVIQYWTESVHVAVWITILLALIIILNIFVVSIYGEAEFWFARYVVLLGTYSTALILRQHKDYYHCGLDYPW